MKNLSLSTRLFLSCFLVSALLFCGIYFSIKGINEKNGKVHSELAFARAEGRYADLLKSQSISLAQVAEGLALDKNSPYYRAGINATGLSWAAFTKGGSVNSELALSLEDQALLKSLHSQETVNISVGHFLADPIIEDSKWKLVLLYPLADTERASREMIEAFLVAGMALLVLTTIFARLLAREIFRPLSQLKDKVRAMADHIGLEPPEEQGDEVQTIAKSYLEFATQLQTAFEHKRLALDELEAYKTELLRVNSTLHRRLFQVKVLLSLWSERDKALDVKDFLSRFLEALLPGLPFEYGCVIIRPIATMDSETIFAKKIQGARPSTHGEDEHGGQGTLWTDIIDPNVKEFLLRESSNCMEQNAVVMGQVHGSIRTGADPSQITVLSFRLKQGEEPLGSVHFLTEQANPQVSEMLNEFLLNLSAQVSAQLQIQALTMTTRLDPLTHLYNRGYLTDRLREEVVRSARKRDPFSLILLDIDHFKSVNEKHGQRAADDVLRGLAALLKRTCRGSDSVCRLSGAVLAIVLADTPLSGAKIFAENLRKSVESEKFAVPGGTLQVTISLGLAEFPTDGDGVEALLMQADHALYAAKDAGRNTWKAAA